MNDYKNSLAYELLGEQEFNRVLAEKKNKNLEKLNNNLSKNIEQIKCYAQCFKEIENGFPDNEGTITLVKIDNKKFIFSAAHCVHNNELFYLNGNTKRVESIPFTKTLISNYKEDETEDIFIGQVDSDFEILNSIFIELKLETEPQNSSYCSFSGFPSTKNGQKWQENEFKNRPYSYYEILHYDKESDNKHLEIQYNLEKSFVEHGTFQNIAPNPTGISGGPIFEIAPTLQDYINGNLKIKLIGIGTDCTQKSSKKLLGHSINYFIALLQEYQFIENKFEHDFNIKHSLFKRL